MAIIRTKKTEEEIKAILRKHFKSKRTFDAKKYFEIRGRLSGVEVRFIKREDVTEIHTRKGTTRDYLVLILYFVFSICIVIIGPLVLILLFIIYLFISTELEKEVIQLLKKYSIKE